LDKTPPTISDASPTGTVGSTSVSFSVKVEDPGSGVNEVKLIVDDVSQGTMSMSGNTYTKTLSLSEGSHTWVVEAVDNVGNTITQNYSFTIAKGLPMEIYLLAIAIVIVIIIAAVAIVLRRRRAPSPSPP
jgi:subtilase family serine protease